MFVTNVYERVIYLELATSSNKCHKTGHIPKACMTAGSSKQTTE